MIKLFVGWYVMTANKKLFLFVFGRVGYDFLNHFAGDESGAVVFGDVDDVTVEGSAEYHRFFHRTSVEQKITNVGRCDERIVFQV